jgi:Ca2+-transporting ATPase
LDRDAREQWLKQNERMAEEGLRVLALAEKTADNMDEEPYEDLVFVGLVGLLDPPRRDVPEAVQRCRDAGVNIVMVTGDHPTTARNVAQAVGIVRGDAEPDVIHGRELTAPQEMGQEELRRMRSGLIFARVSPKQKLDLIKIHQDEANVVAMTGDGVNDAPALKQADIGIAMGQRGTEVAREASDMVLLDDAFPTIVDAVELGRVIFDNIRKFVLYLLSCNLSEILVVGLAAGANAPLPILPLQILFLNIVTDVFPALALGMGEGTRAVMRRGPRDSGEPVLGREQWVSIGVYSAAIAFSVLGGFALALTWLEADTERAVTISFLILACAQLWHVLDMRDQPSNLLKNDITRNPYIWYALGLCLLLLMGAVYLPGLSNVLRLTHPQANGWLLIIAASIVPVTVGQLYSTWRWRKASAK